MNGKRIVVTGGAGFVGSHLCEALVEEGHHVICVDNLHTGRKSNIEPLLASGRFEFIEHNIIEPLDLGEKSVDQIYNLACPASPVHYQQDPIFTLQTNIWGMKNVLDLAQQKGARVLQASTSEVYGDPLEHPQQESYWGNVNPNGIRACYDEGKRAAETLCFDYHRRFNTQVRVARIFNTYGPRMLADDGRVVSNFIVQAQRGQSLTVYGDGSQTRSFCYVSDLVLGLVALMNAQHVTGAVNLGNPSEFTIAELAEKVIALAGGKGEIDHQPLPGDDPKRRRPVIDVAKDKLGWRPEVGLDEGLQLTWYGFLQQTV